MLILLPFYSSSASLLALMQEAGATDFNDLGKILLVGVVLAIVVAIAFTIVRLRIRDKRPPGTEFISINPFREKK